MTATQKVFVVGERYSNEQIYLALAIGNAGGVRVKSDGGTGVRRAAIFTSIPTPRQLVENPYRDRIEGDVLVYTGTGLAGDQQLAGPNARLRLQPELGYPLYAFAQISSRRSGVGDNRRWMFLGLIDLLRSYRETQCDASGTSRSVWVFEFQIQAEPSQVSVDGDLEAALLARTLSPPRCRGEDGEIAALEDGVGTEQATPSAQELEPIRKHLLALEPRQFELFLCDLLAQSGFEAVEVTRFSQDGGVDVNARVGSNSWPLRKVLLQVQAKRWLHTVGRKEVAELRGSMQPHSTGCIVTTSHFSRAAIAESSEVGKVPINLIDGFELAQWARLAGLALM